jgi:hypothetical protein
MNIDDPEILLSPSRSNYEEEKNTEIEERKNGSDSPTLKNLKHRDFLQNKVKFKQVVRIDDETILEAIHLSYRLTYLKDTAIARFVDDSVLATIN